MAFTKKSLLAIMATLSSFSATLALPTAGSTGTLEKRVAPNTQWCTAQDHVWVSYSTDIGITYANGIGCNDVFNALNNAVGIWNWQCVDDGSGGTQLWFNAWSGNGAGINGALLSMYPTIEGGFNCPDF